MYEPVIGLEVHLQPTTKSKMFCSCSAEYFGHEPNTHTCPICLGLPGALPVPNKAAIDQCLKLGLALHCDINKQSKFDRKNYFYPDLPKGYQISQYDLPFCLRGFLEIEADGDSRRIRITRVHLEEDTAKSMHSGDLTLIDFNKSGVPLIELVTEPDFKTLEEVDRFAKLLRRIVRYLGISDADMEKGQMRFELNMSLRKAGEKELPQYKVEVKNIASISVLQKVIDFETQRQSKLLEKGIIPEQETRGLKDMSGETVSQRKKEQAEDYRYFPEPDIPVIEIDDEWIKAINSELIELPHDRKARLMQMYDLEPSTAEAIVSARPKAEWFEAGIPDKPDNDTVNQYAKWFVGDFTALKKASAKNYTEIKMQPQQLYQIAALFISGELSGTLAKQLLEKVFDTGADPGAVMEQEGMKVIGDANQLETIIREVFKEQPKVVADSKKNPNAAKFLLGQVMRKTRGKADPQKSLRLIETELARSD